MVRCDRAIIDGIGGRYDRDIKGKDVAGIKAGDRIAGAGDQVLAVVEGDNAGNRPPHP